MSFDASAFASNLSKGISSGVMESDAARSKHNGLKANVDGSLEALSEMDHASLMEIVKADKSGTANVLAEALGVSTHNFELFGIKLFPRKTDDIVSDISALTQDGKLEGTGMGSYIPKKTLNDFPTDSVYGSLLNISKGGVFENLGDIIKG